MDSTQNDTPQPQYLKLEDLQSAVSPATTTTVYDGTVGTQQSPASVVIHSRPAKKRKSWGQELPQPKTNLPPRKRAKTDDEKEQRRIERIKRNRAAAHNSRERKRQETENLAVLLARARAELDAYKRLHGPLPADIVLPEVTLNKDPESPGPKYSEEASSSCMPSPAISLLDSNISIKQEPLDANTVSPMAINVVRPAVSVEPQECEEEKATAVVVNNQNLEQTIFDLPSLSRMVGEAVSLSYPSPNSECLPADHAEHVDHLAFSDASFDHTSHSTFHDDTFTNDAFFFDDLIDTDAVAAFAIDPATGAA